MKTWQRPQKDTEIRGALNIHNVTTMFLDIALCTLDATCIAHVCGISQ